MVWHAATERLRQVGTGCERDFLGGHDPERLCRQAEYVPLARESIAAAAGPPHEPAVAADGVALETFAAHAAMVLRAHGWVTRERARDTGRPASADAALDSLHNAPGAPRPGDVATARAALHWARELARLADRETRLESPRSSLHRLVECHLGDACASRLTSEDCERRYSVTGRDETGSASATTSGDAHARASYERCYTESWAEKMLEHAECWLDGRHVKLQSWCPRCGHQLDDYLLFGDSVEATPSTLELKIVDERLAKALRPLPLRWVTACNCESEHQGRPAGKRGCGSFARLEGELARESEDGRTRKVFLTHGRGILRDLEWREAAEQAELTRLPQVQTHAEKQSGFFTALLGLLSAGLVLQGTQHILDKQQWARWCITVAFAAGVAAGAYAILLVARAARGAKHAPADVQAQDFYENTTAEVRKAMKSLDKAAYPAGLALMFLTATVALIWLTPD